MKFVNLFEYRLDSLSAWTARNENTTTLLDGS